MIQEARPPRERPPRYHLLRGIDRRCREPNVLVIPPPEVWQGLLFGPLLIHCGGILSAIDHHAIKVDSVPNIV